MSVHGSTIAAVMVTSISAMVKIFIVLGVGVLCAFYPKENPLLPLSSLKMLSTLSNYLFLPSLIITSLGSTLSVAILAKLSILVVFAFMNNITSYILAYTFGRWLHDGDQAMFTAISVAAGSPNAISFPLLILQTICEQSTVNIDYDNDSSKCFTDASSMIFVYSIGWHIMFWTYGFPTLQTLATSTGQESTTFFSDIVDKKTWERIVSYMKTSKGKSDLKTWLYDVMCAPSMLAIYVGISVGLIPFLKSNLFQNAQFLHPLGSALTTIGQPVICMNTLVMAASLAHADWRKKSKGPSFYATILSPFHFNDKQESDIIIGTSDSSGEIISQTEDNMDPSKRPTLETEKIDLPSWRQLAFHFFCRLVLPPAVIIPLIELFQTLGFYSKTDRLMKLLIGIESCAPSAQLIIISLNQLGIRKVASNIAYMFFIQYVVVIFTVTCWVTVLMTMIY